MEMKPYFLVQRIKPARGYPKAGIPGLARYFLDSKRKLRQALKESLDALQDIIPLDYMGSAEFEFGSVPQCLSEIVERRAELTPFAVDITGTPDFYATAAEQPALHEEASKHQHKVRLEGWCLKGDEKNLADFIRKQAAGKIDQYRLKERTDMQAGCFGIVRYPFANGKLQKNLKPEFRAPELSAWMDLNSLWFVSRDPQQTAGLKHLLEIKL